MNLTLVDTSVWRRHFAGRLTTQQRRWMGDLLDEPGVVLLHPWVLGELVLGGLSPRGEALVSLLPPATEIEHDHVILFARSHRLARRGIGWVDAQLLASALVDSARVWAIDGSLEMVADELNLRFSRP